MSETPLKDPDLSDLGSSGNLPVPRRGAGGTPGGIGTFFLGVILAAAGGYLILNQVTVAGTFGGMWFLGGHGGFGLVMLPFLIGAGMLFVNGKSFFGWVLTLGGASIIVASILMNMTIYWRSAPLFQVLVMFLMFVAGVSMIFRSLRPYPAR